MSDKRIYLKTPRGEEISTIQAPPCCFCQGCFTAVPEHDPIAVCCDCGAIFCQTCVQNGMFDSHSCDDEDSD